MNGKQQQERRTAVLSLQQQLAEVESAAADMFTVEVSARQAAIDELREEFRMKISEIGRYEKEQTLQQRNYVDRSDRDICRRLDRIEKLLGDRGHRGTWTRLRCLFLGMWRA